jgi:uncharacterized protein (DUF1501 family)
MQRRTVLKLAAAGIMSGFQGLPAIVSRAYAAPGAADAKLLLVFLRGGYDAANVVIPVGSPFYYEARPTLALARPDPSNPQAAIPLAGPGDAVGWGLHPALKDSIYPLWQAGQVAFVTFAGTTDMSRSHFETQDSVESGLPAGSRTYGSGFMNRLAVALGGTAAPVAFTDGLPVVLRGDLVVPNVSLKGTGRPPFDDRQVAVLAGMYAGTRFEHLISEGFELRKTVAEQNEMMASGGTSGEMQAANRNAISARGFELETRRMAALMRDRFNLAFIDVGGWDTHVSEGGAQGQLANLLGNLGQGLAAFAEQMGSAWRSTVVVVISEFGRTFRENGTRGTDHGHGTVYWVLGGSVRGGRIAGDQVAVERSTLNQDRDWPVLNEYRALFGGLFKTVFGLDAARTDRVFPNTAPRDLGLV